MNHITNLYHCHECDTAVYIRHESEKRTCECTALYVDQFMATSEKEWSEYYGFELRVTKEVLEEDYNDFRDRYGLIRNATKAIPILIKAAGKPIEKRMPKPYEDYSDIIEHDIEHRLKLKEKDLEKMNK